MPPPLLPQPSSRAAAFDPWNTLSSGHQVGDSNRLSGSTSWRQGRTSKLSAQFRGDQSGGARVADSVGAGSAHFGRDGRKANGSWDRGAAGLRRELGCRSVTEMMRAGVTKKTGMKDNNHHDVGKKVVVEVGRGGDTPAGGAKPTKRMIFDGLCFYINGSTAPEVSDHRLKYLIAENGGRVAIGLARRTVTHVVLGTPNAGETHVGAGGGLAAGKMQKEVLRRRGCVVRYVRVDWVLESIKSGRRLPETAFSAVNLVASGQKSLFGMLKTTPESERL